MAKQKKRKPSVVIDISENGHVLRRKPRSKLAAPPAAQIEHSGRWKAEKDEIDRRKSNEAQRVLKTREGKAKTSKRNTTVTVMDDHGERRTVKKIRTTADKMLTAGTMPKTLRVAIDAFSLLVGDSLGVATEDSHASTSRMTSSYEPMASSGFGSKSLSDRMLNGLTAYRVMKSRIPAELMDVFHQIIGEETGHLRVKRKTLSEIGEERGFKHKQASSAGAMAVICIANLINHFMLGELRIVAGSQQAA